MPVDSLLQRICQAEFDCNPRAFLRAASQRLEAANLLLESGLSLDAVYLAGYVVECALKALILQRTPARRRPEVCQELTAGSRSQNYDVLVAILRARKCPPPPGILGLVDTLNERWRTNLRYSGALIPEREAEQFLGEIKAVNGWV